MARTRTAPWDYVRQWDPPSTPQDQAERVLLSLWKIVGDDVYAAWVDYAIEEDDSWTQVKTKALDAIDTATAPHWSDNPRYWAGDY